VNKLTAIARVFVNGTKIAEFNGKAPDGGGLVGLETYSPKTGGETAPILTNSSRQLLLISKHPREDRAFRMQCANALLRQSPRNVYSVHWFRDRRRQGP
jgi:hypothetical protein